VARTLLALRRLVPRAPGSLVVVALAVLVATVLDLAHGIAQIRDVLARGSR
jgi:hypothetical protein